MQDRDLGRTVVLRVAVVPDLHAKALRIGSHLGIQRVRERQVDALVARAQRNRQVERPASPTDTMETTFARRTGLPTLQANDIHLPVDWREAATHAARRVVRWQPHDTA